MNGRVVYTFGEVLGGPGIGRIANYAVAGLSRANMLARTVSMEASNPHFAGDTVTTVPFGTFLNHCPNYFLKDSIFDLLASRRLPKSFTALHGWNSMCLRCLKKAKERGALTVVERASTHPTVQRNLVEEEYNRHDIDTSFSSDRAVRRMNEELRETDVIFVPSQFVYDSFIDEGFDDEKLRLIPFGVDTTTFHPPDQKHRRRSDEFQAVFVGQVSLRKGIQYLLPAWEQADVDGELIIAGKVTDTAKDIVDEYRDNTSIKFLGWVDDMPGLYRQSDAFVFPTIEEGSALVSYEAMASGLPSIVTRNAGSLVEDNHQGIVVEPRDIGEIVDAIETLAADSDLREQYGAAAREKVGDYTWERYGDQVAEVYHQLLSNK